MVARSKYNDRGIHFDPEDRFWRYDDTNESVFDNWVERTCSNCKCGVCDRESEAVIVLLKDGTKALRFIDKCIANLIRELNLLGIHTTSSSCCGHGKSGGEFFIPREFIEEHERGYKVKIPKRVINDANEIH